MLKHIIASMGSNLTEGSLQKAARSVSTLQMICRRFDKESDVAVGTRSHSTLSDLQDVTKVIRAVIKEKLLQVSPRRAHKAYHTIKLNPLCDWDKEKTKEWIEKKKRDFLKFQGAMRREGEEGDESDHDSDSDSDSDASN